MSTVTPLIDHVDDLLAGTASRRREVLDQLVLASNLLGAEPRGLELRRRQHVRQGHRARPHRPRGRR